MAGITGPNTLNTSRKYVLDGTEYDTWNDYLQARIQLFERYHPHMSDDEGLRYFNKQFIADLFTDRDTRNKKGFQDPSYRLFDKKSLYLLTNFRDIQASGKLDPLKYNKEHDYVNFVFETNALHPSKSTRRSFKHFGNKISWSEAHDRKRSGKKKKFTARTARDMVRLAHATGVKPMKFSGTEEEIKLLEEARVAIGTEIGFREGLKIAGQCLKVMGELSLDLWEVVGKGIEIASEEAKKIKKPDFSKIKLPKFPKSAKMIVIMASTVTLLNCGGVKKAIDSKQDGVENTRGNKKESRKEARIRILNEAREFGTVQKGIVQENRVENLEKILNNPPVTTTSQKSDGYQTVNTRFTEKEQKDAFEKEEEIQRLAQKDPTLRKMVKVRNNLEWQIAPYQQVEDRLWLAQELYWATQPIRQLERQGGMGLPNFIQLPNFKIDDDAFQIENILNGGNRFRSRNFGGIFYMLDLAQEIPDDHAKAWKIDKDKLAKTADLLWDNGKEGLAARGIRPSLERIAKWQRKWAAQIANDQLRNFKGQRRSNIRTDWQSKINAQLSALNRYVGNVLTNGGAGVEGLASMIGDIFTPGKSIGNLNTLYNMTDYAEDMSIAYGLEYDKDTRSREMIYDQLDLIYKGIDIRVDNLNGKSTHRLEKKLKKAVKEFNRKYGFSFIDENPELEKDIFKDKLQQFLENQGIISTGLASNGTAYEGEISLNAADTFQITKIKPKNQKGLTV